MKPTKYSEKNKLLWHYKQQFNYFNTAIRNQSRIPIKEPYQRGWILSWEFRKDIQNREDFELLKKIRDFVHCSTWNKNKYPVLKRHCTSSLEDFLPRFRDITQKEYDVLLPHVKKYFYIVFDKYLRPNYRLVFPRYWFELKATPHIVDFEYEHDVILYQQRDFYYDMLYHSYYFKEIMSGHYRNNIRKRATDKTIIKQMLLTKNWDLQDCLKTTQPSRYSW